MITGVKKANIAELISTARLFAAPVVLITTLMGFKIITGCIIAIALFSDMLDGPVARYFESESKNGTRLDSIADASIFITSVFSVGWFSTDFVVAHLSWVLAVFGIYFFQVILALVRYRRISTFHKYSAKIASFPIGLFLVSCFFIGPVEWLFYVASISGLLAEAEEIALIAILARPRDNVKGIYWVLKEGHR